MKVKRYTWAMIHCEYNYKLLIVLDRYRVCSVAYRLCLN